MHTRVADLRARHAPSGLLVTRDWLLIVLSFSSGIFEGICFLSFGKVFSSFQTGNLVLVGLAVGGTRPPQGADPGTVLVSLGAFALGAALAMPILHSFDGDLELEDSKVLHIWPRQVTLALGLSLVAQLSFLSVWIASPAETRPVFLLEGLIAFAMGVQMNAIRLLHVPGISTTAATATYISLVSGLATRTLTAPVIRRLSGVVLAIAVGALVGDLMLRHATTDAPVVPVVVNAVVLGFAATSLPEGSVAEPLSETGSGHPEARQLTLWKRQS